jgi:hypothetical protein
VFSVQPTEHTVSDRRYDDPGLSCEGEWASFLLFCKMNVHNDEIVIVHEKSSIFNKDEDNAVASIS